MVGFFLSTKPSHGQIFSSEKRYNFFTSTDQIHLMFTPNAQFWDVQSHWDHRGMDEHWLFRKDGSGGKKGKLLFMNDINQNVQSSVEE